MNYKVHVRRRWPDRGQDNYYGDAVIASGHEIFNGFCDNIKFNMHVHGDLQWTSFMIKLSCTEVIITKYECAGLDWGLHIIVAHRI